MRGGTASERGGDTPTAAADDPPDPGEGNPDAR